MRRRTTVLLLVASVVGLIAATYTAMFAVVIEPELALTWWVIGAGSFTLLMRGDGVVIGSAVGTVVTIVALAAHELYLCGVSGTGCVGAVVGFTAIVLAYARRKMTALRTL